MAANPLTPTFDDTTANAALITAGGRRHSVNNETLILLRNVQYQLDALEARIATLETP